MDARNQDHEYANKLIRLSGIERLTNQVHIAFLFVHVR